MIFGRPQKDLFLSAGRSAGARGLLFGGRTLLVPIGGMDTAPGQRVFWKHDPTTIHVDVRATRPGARRVSVAGDLDVVSASTV